MKLLYIIFLTVLLPLHSFGQNAYLLKDSVASNGIKLKEGGDKKNSQLCQLIKEDKIIEYSPYEVKEYGFKDGRVYISKEIQVANSSKRVFLERLNNGKISLYYYRGRGVKTFFIEKDSSILIEMPKKNEAKEHYSELLSNFTDDCPNALDACKLVSYNKKPLSKFITRYNQCELKPFPHFKYGVLIGYEFSRLIPMVSPIEGLENYDYNYEGDFSIGIFIDNPINVSDFSVHAELLFSKHGYLYNNYADNTDIDFVANLSSLKIPLLIRYAYPSNKIRPFINIGLIGTYFIKNETLFYKAFITENIIEINESNKPPTVNDFQGGFNIGSGIEYKLNRKNSMFLEFRYTKQYCIGSPHFFGTSSFNLLTGINF